MTQAKKILILCSRLDLPGGIERAITNTANLLKSKGQEVSLLVLDDTAESFFPVEKDIQLLALPMHFGITGKGNVMSRKMDFFQHVKRLKRKIGEVNPDIIIATEYPFTIAALLAVKKTTTAVFAWEHHHFHHLPKSSFWKFLHKKLYHKTKAVICLNSEEARMYQAMGCRTVVIPNFVEQGESSSLVNRKLLTVGWLSKTKGVDYIPLVAEKIFKLHSDWQWKIIGTGAEETWLKNELRQKGLQEHVIINSPTTNDLKNDYLAASMYVMTSRFECFPMVLLEAASHGVPSIAFDCATGPKHIINNGETGYLIKEANIDAMVKAIDDLINNVEKRQVFGIKAFQSIRRFHPNEIYKLWEKLLGE